MKWVVAVATAACMLFVYPSFADIFSRKPPVGKVVHGTSTRGNVNETGIAGIKSLRELQGEATKEATKIKRLYPSFFRETRVESSYCPSSGDNNAFIYFDLSYINPETIKSAVRKVKSKGLKPIVVIELRRPCKSRESCLKVWENRVKGKMPPDLGEYEVSYDPEIRRKMDEDGVRAYVKLDSKKGVRFGAPLSEFDRLYDICFGYTR